MADTFLEELLDDLESNGVGTKGTDLFANHMPDISASCVCLYKNGGEPYGYSNFNDVRVGVRVRASTFASARTLAIAVSDNFHARTGYNLEDNRVVAGYSVGMPTTLGEDSHERHLVGFMMYFKTILTDQTEQDQTAGVHGGKGGAVGTTFITPLT